MMMEGLRILGYFILRIAVSFIIPALIFLIYSPNCSGQNSDIPDTLRLVELNDVEIIGQRTPGVYKNLARKVTVISSQEIKSSPASTIQDLLEYAAGVDIRQRNIHGVQADIQIRGGTFDQVMVLLNGVNITDPQTGHFSLDLPVELASVERIEILHGSGSRIYGADAYKGVINIITKKDTDLFATGIEYGQFNLLHANVYGAFSSGRIYNSMSFSRNISAGYTDNTDYKINHIFYQGGLRSGKVNIFWQGGMNRKAFGANDFYSPKFPEQYEETSAGFGSIGFNRKGKINYSIVGYWRQHNDHFMLKRGDPLFYENFHKTDIFGVKGNVDFTSFLGKTSIGIEARDEDIHSTLLGDLLDIPVRIKGTDSTFYTNQFNRVNFSYFIEQKYVTGRFSFTGGVLIDRNNNFPYKTGFFPGLDVSYNFLGDRAKFFISLNRSLRRPTFTDMFYKDPANEGSRELTAERLIAFESGAEFRSDDISANITLFRDHGKQVIDWVWLSERSLFKAMNIAEITTQGIELSGDYNYSKGNKQFYFKKLGANISAINMVKVSGDFVSKYSLDFLKYKIGIHTTFNFTRAISANMQVNYLVRNGSYVDYDSTTGSTFTAEFEPYWITDLKVSYATKRFLIYINSSNLFDTDYTDVGNLIQPGRWITAGIQVTFSGTR